MLVTCFLRKKYCVIKKNILVNQLIYKNPHGTKQQWSPSQEEGPNKSANTLLAKWSVSPTRPRLLRQHGGSSENLESRFKTNTTGWLGPVKTPLMRRDVQRRKMYNVNGGLLVKLFLWAARIKRTNVWLLQCLYLNYINRPINSWSRADLHLYFLPGIL